MTVVLDSSVVLAVVQGEAGGEAAVSRLDGASISAVNYHEVVAKLAENGIADTDIARLIDTMPFTIHPHDAAQARSAGLLRPATRAAGLSLGDRACLALGMALDAPVLTADRAWAALDLSVAVEVIR